MTDQEERNPFLEENLWGYGKRLCFVDEALQREFPGTPRRQLSVLDIGSGNGSQLAIPLANAGYQVTAVDPHQPSIDRGRTLNSAVRFVHGTVSAIDAGPFHCVVLSEVLEHLDEPKIVLRLALPCLAEGGVLIVTVPNGYGEFELDRRSYQALHLDKLVAWLRSLLRAERARPSLASSDCYSPHVQRFTLPALQRMFARHQLQVVEARATSLVSGPMIAHLLARSKRFVRWNAAAADHVPLSLAAGWMFLLKRSMENLSKEYTAVTQRKVSR